MMVHDNVLPMEGSSRVLARANHHIGTILVEEGKLKSSDIERINELHNRAGMRFGEAALRLGLLTQDDLQAALAKQYDLPLLLSSSKAASRELIAVHLPHDPRTEELRGLRTQLLIRWFSPDAGRRALAIMSPESGDGRSYLAANLAVVFSQLGLRTLLIDADLRNPRQHKIFNVPDHVGLASILAGRADTSAVVAVPGIPKLSLLTAGGPPPNPQELLSRFVLASLLDDLKVKFDLILFDTSASRYSADSRSVAFRAGSAVMLVRKNHTRVGETNGMVQELISTGTRVAGTVVNSIPD